MAIGVGHGHDEEAEGCGGSPAGGGAAQPVNSWVLPVSGAGGCAVGMRLGEMPPVLRARVEAALAGTAARPPKEAGAVETRASRRGPNKTEAEYNRLHLGGRGLYEAVTLRLPGGSRYTPDWMTVSADGTVELHEVKGPYRFGSQGRALTAFRECAAAFPCFRFVWAVRGKGFEGWTVRRYEQTV